MKLVLLESPYAGKSAAQIMLHRDYALAAVRDCYRRGEAAYASHLFFTQMLDDGIPEERAFGIEAGLAWGSHAELTVVYMDLGMSTGMIKGVERAAKVGRIIVERTLLKSSLTIEDLQIPFVRRAMNAIMVPVVEK